MTDESCGVMRQAEKKARQREREKERKRLVAVGKAEQEAQAKAAAEAEIEAAAAQAAAQSARWAGRLTCSGPAFPCNSAAMLPHASMPSP